MKTTKIEIYRGILETRNQIDIEEGRKPRLNVDACIERCHGCKDRTIKELNDELEIARHCLKAARMKRMREEWRNTDEGATATAKAKEETERLKKVSREQYDRTERELKSYLESTLDGDWRPINLSQRHVGIALYGTDGKYGSNYFDIYFENDRPTNIFNPGSYEMGCSSISSFNPLDDTLRAKFLMGMAILATPECATRLHGILLRLANETETVGAELLKQKQILERPEDYYPDFFNQHNTQDND